MNAIKIIVNGRVQGVGFRHFICQRAVNLGLKGYVKNLPNSNVEILAIGEEASIRELTECAESGPRFADVDEIEIIPLNENNFHQYNDFTIHH